MSLEKCFAVYFPLKSKTVIILGEGNFWFHFRLFIQFLALWSMNEKVGILDNRAEAEFEIALAKYHLTHNKINSLIVGLLCHFNSLMKVASFGHKLY